MSIYDESEKLRKKLENERKLTVSVALFGQPGSGKSSLINKLVGEHVAEVGVETDLTRGAETYPCKGINLVDLPGYGTSLFPKESFATRFGIKDFDLFLCVTSGKLHQADTEFFQELRRLGKVCLFVINKHDELWEDGVELKELERRKIADIQKHAGGGVDCIFTSCRNNSGLDELNSKIMANLDDAKKERWARGAKAYSKAFLEKKKAACNNYVALAAWAAAANGVNPIPGVDVGVDLGILMKLFSEIREAYGLGDDLLTKLKASGSPVVTRLAGEVIEFATKKGLQMLLTRFAGRETAKTLAKYIPIVGQLVAAGLGYAITSSAGNSYLEDCHQLAEEILANNLQA